MATILSLLKKFEQLDTDKIINESFEETKGDFVQENRDQLLEGYDKTGEKIKRKYRSNKYARVKNEMNPLPGLGIPDLKVTGDFQRGIVMDVSGDILNIRSLDEKNDDLVKKYDNIYGLGGDHKKKHVNEKLRPTVNNKITSATGLKFGK